MLGNKMSNGTNTSGKSMNVPYDKWGREVSNEIIRDEDGNTVGSIDDETIFIYEEDVQPVTKKQVLQDIDGWRNDDGTYGDGDVNITIAYEDGTFVTSDDLNGRRYKKSGIIGASISTADYEMVWGGEINRNGRFVEWQTWSEDGESGKSNAYSGYKAVEKYRQRVRTTYNNPNGRGGYKTVRTIIRKSKKVPVN